MVVVVSALLLALRGPRAGTDSGDLLLWNAAARTLRRGPRPGLRADQAHGPSGVDALASHAPATAGSLATGRAFGRCSPCGSVPPRLSESGFVAAAQIAFR